MKVLALMAIPAPIKDQIAALPNVQIEGPDYLAQHGLTDITAIFGWQSRLNDLIKENSTVRFVQSFSAGVDYFPLATFQKKNIVMANTSGIHARPIAESVLAYVLAFARGIADSAHRTPENFWDRDASRGDVYTLPGKTALIYGTGHIGRAIAEILTQQGMTVTGISHHGEAVAPLLHRRYRSRQCRICQSRGHDHQYHAADTGDASLLQRCILQCADEKTVVYQCRSRSFGGHRSTGRGFTDGPAQRCRAGRVRTRTAAGDITALASAAFAYDAPRVRCIRRNIHGSSNDSLPQSRPIYPRWVSGRKPS